MLLWARAARGLRCEQQPQEVTGTGLGCEGDPCSFLPVLTGTSGKLKVDTNACVHSQAYFKAVCDYVDGQLLPLPVKQPKLAPPHFNGHLVLSMAVSRGTESSQPLRGKPEAAALSNSTSLSNTKIFRKGNLHII